MNFKEPQKSKNRLKCAAQEMCASIGVDPLASGKGFWSNMLDIGDFYYELGVQVWLGAGEGCSFW